MSVSSSTGLNQGIITVSGINVKGDIVIEGAGNYIEFPDGTQQYSAAMNTGDSASLVAGTVGDPQIFTGYNEFTNNTIFENGLTVGATTTFQVDGAGDVIYNGNLNIGQLKPLVYLQGLVGNNLNNNGGIGNYPGDYNLHNSAYNGDYGYAVGGQYYSSRIINSIYYTAPTTPASVNTTYVDYYGNMRFRQLTTAGNSTISANAPTPLYIDSTGNILINGTQSGGYSGTTTFVNGLTISGGNQILDTNVSIYLYGDGTGSYYLSNTGGAFNDRLFSYGGSTFLDYANQINFRVGAYGDATKSVTMQLNKNGLGGASVGGTVTFTCIGASGEVATDVRPTCSNYASFGAPNNGDLITYQDLINNIPSAVGTIANYTTYLLNQSLSNTSQNLMGKITMPTAGIWTINMYFGFSFSAGATGPITVSLRFNVEGGSPVPFPFVNYSSYIFGYSHTDPNNFDIQQPYSITLKITASTTLDLDAYVDNVSGVSFNANATSGIQNYYFYAIKIG